MYPSDDKKTFIRLEEPEPESHYSHRSNEKISRELELGRRLDLEEEKGNESSQRVKRMFYRGFLFPPLWLLGFTFIFRTQRHRSLSNSRIPNSDESRRTEKKYAIRCLYAFLIFCVALAGLGVIIWVVVNLKRFEGEVERVSIGTSQSQS